MPPTPKPKKAATKGRSQPSTPKAERGSSARESSSAPRTAPRSRATKVDVLHEQVRLMYSMMGTMLTPFGRFYPALGPVGSNMRELSTEAADAWIELAQKEPRVMDALVSLTAASTWGNVIGIHLAILSAAIPGGGYASQVVNQPQDPSEDIAEAWRQGRSMGMSDEEIEQAISQTMGTPMPARETETGGPGDTVRTGGTPVPAGIVSPEELGVTQFGEDQIMPTDTAPPNGSGTVING